MAKRSRFSPEVRERAVRLVAESEPSHPSHWAAVVSVAEKIGCSAETLRSWGRQAERNTSLRACRCAVYEAARQVHPERWSGAICAWTARDVVILTRPRKQETHN